MLVTSAVVAACTSDPSPTVEILDVRTGRWERGPDLPATVHHAMAATVNETIYVFGGYLASHVPSTGAFRLTPGGWGHGRRDARGQSGRDGGRR
jgi:hypothetical protein